MLGVVQRQRFVNNKKNKNYQHCQSSKIVKVLLLQRTVTLGQAQPLSFAQSTRSVMKKKKHTVDHTVCFNEADMEIACASAC